MMTRKKKLFFAAVATIISLWIINFVASKIGVHPAKTAYEKVYQSHPTRVYTLKPNAQAIMPMGVYGQYVTQWEKSGAIYEVQVNPQGWRDRPFGPHAKTRIVALGDSSTFGWDVELNDTYAKQLERMLQAQGHDVEVLNIAVPGYSSHQGVLMMPEVWKLEPDVLLVSFGRNDDIDSNHSPTQYGRGRTDREIMPGDRIVGPPKPTLVQRLREAPLFLAAENFYFRRIRNKPPPRGEVPEADHAKHRVSVAEYQENLRTIIRQARERHTRVLLVNIGCFFEKYRQAMMDVAREEKIGALNTFPLLFAKVDEIKTAPRFATCRQRLISWLSEPTLNSSLSGWLWFSTDFGHPNPCGHQVIAEALAPIVLPKQP